MRGVNLLGLAVACGKLKHGARNLVLAVGWQAAHRFKGLFKKLGHEASLGARVGDIKASMSPRPSDRLAIAIAQLNPTLGDIAGNADKARRARAEAAREGADLVALPELFLSGYPPEDLVLKPALQAACRAKIDELARETADGGPGAVDRHAMG